MPTITELRASYQSGDLTPGDAIRTLSKTIDNTDGEIKGYISYDTDAALAEAQNVDLSLPLGGVPIAIKDVINVKGQPCTCGSNFLDQKYTAPYDAGVIKKLRAAGAIPFGRANMDEFAMGSSTENSAIQTTRNPWDTSRIPGGSSGGSAAVVAANEAIAALGSDTGGSIRQPAALCGCVGLKPTYGRVSRYGLVAFASSLDQIGPMTQTVEDAALLLQAIAGHDAHDSTCVKDALPDYSSFVGQDIKGLKIGLPKEYFAEGLDAEVKNTVEAAIAQLESLGAEPVEISLPHTEYAVATYYIIATAEASTNLARFDAVRYGRRAPDADNLIDQYRRSREQGFGEEVKRRIILGTYVLSSGYYDAYYLQAQKVRTLIRKDFTEAFEKVDLIASPVTPTPAFKIGEKSNDPMSMYLADIYTISANLAGICGISVPCGFTQSDDNKPLPVGLQLLGKPFAEGDLIKAAHAYEKSTAWQKTAL
ncbi:MAG: Asp-tRNA(Asn)/Glu-tRNA(Gln) amidotransferase subunit GatA [Verrucomicrobiota bacterium]